MPRRGGLVFFSKMLERYACPPPTCERGFQRGTVAIAFKRANHRIRRRNRFAGKNRFEVP